MRLVKAYIRKLVADQVIHALEKIKVSSLTAIDVKAVGEDVSETNYDVSVEYGTTYAEMVKLEVIVSEKEEQKVIDEISKHAKTGHKGDGIITVSALKSVIRINGHA